MLSQLSGLLPKLRLPGSSRNSEVVHAGEPPLRRALVSVSSDDVGFSGLYYPPESLKTQLCLRDRHLMYERCDKYNIPYRKTGKLVVAHEHQRSYVESLFAKARQLPWPKHSPPHGAEDQVLPVSLISGAQARELEPDLSPDIAAALWSPETGMVDSHSVMESLEKDISESEGGQLVFSTRVVRVDPYKSEETSKFDSEKGWVVQTVTENAEQGDSLLARTLINASGLSANLIPNSLLPEVSRIPMFFAPWQDIVPEHASADTNYEKVRSFISEYV